MTMYAEVESQSKREAREQAARQESHLRETANKIKSASRSCEHSLSMAMNEVIKHGQALAEVLEKTNGDEWQDLLSRSHVTSEEVDRYVRLAREWSGVKEMDLRLAAVMKSVGHRETVGPVELVSLGITQAADQNGTMLINPILRNTSREIIRSWAFDLIVPNGGGSVVPGRTSDATILADMGVAICGRQPLFPGRLTTVDTRDGLQLTRRPGGGDKELVAMLFVESSPEPIIRRFRLSDIR